MLNVQKSFPSHLLIQVQVHSNHDEEIIKSFSCFREVAYCGSYRNDGRLLVAGDDEGLVRLFDVARKTLLRTFRGHEGLVTTCRLFVSRLIYVAIRMSCLQAAALGIILKVILFFTVSVLENSDCSLPYRHTC